MQEYDISTPAGELQERLEKFQKMLRDKDVEASLVIQKTDLFYFSGTSQQGWLYVPAEGKPLLMIFKDFSRARVESPLEQVCSLVSPKKIPEALAERGYRLPERLGMELDVLPANLYFQFQEIFPHARISDISLYIRLIRAVKSGYELALIKQAAAYADEVAARVVRSSASGQKRGRSCRRA